MRQDRFRFNSEVFAVPPARHFTLLRARALWLRDLSFGMVSTQEVPMLPPVIPHALSPKTVLIGPLGTRTGGFAKRTVRGDRKSTRLNSSHVAISYAVFCLKK